jgi:exopolyphosphatase/guanosine-5'-triphosphate,3'-diphosphate pyrophosphatase
MLAPEALARTFATLGEFRKVIDDSGAPPVRMVATSATRDASNSAEFSAGVRRILDISPEVVSGDQEARLSFSGATAELIAGASGQVAGGQLAPPYLVADIGGGSTEFVLGSPVAAGTDPDLAEISVNIGSVRLTERYLHDDPPTAAQIAAATADIDATLASAERTVPAGQANTLVGLAGSVTTLTAVALGLTVYDSDRVHHARISADRVHQVTMTLLGQTREQRAANQVIHPGRVDVIGAGALILDRVLVQYGFDEVVASEHDILDGIAWSMVVR